MQNEFLEGLKDVLKMVRPNTDPNTVKMDSRLLEDLGLDSLSMLLVSLGIEKKYEMRFDKSVQLKTVQDVVDAVMKAKN